MQEFEKKYGFFLKRPWIFAFTCVTLFALFSPLLVWAVKEKTDRSAVKGSLTKSETEGTQAENGNNLAKLESENVRLYAENVQEVTENDRQKVELLRLESELKTLREENSRLRKELLETLNSYSTLSERLKRIELSAAGIVETLNPAHADSRDADYALSLNLFLRSGNELLAKSMAVQEFLKERFSELKLEPADAVKLREALEELEKSSENFAMLNNPPVDPDNFQGCRILEINDSLKAVVLSAGYRNGIRTGMILTTGSGENRITLRIAAVRQFISAAVVENGDFNKLSLGMSASIIEAK